MISQLRGIAFYEAKIQWRRRVLALLLLALLVLHLFITVQTFRSLTRSLSAQVTGAALVEALHLQATVNGMFGAWTATTILFMAALPLVLADTIPSDSQYGVRELLDALPAGPGVYLSGKVLGVWLVLLPGLIAVAAAGFVAISLATAPMNPAGYAMAWLMVLPLALFIATASIILPLGQPNRRRAVTIGFSLFVALFGAIIVTQVHPSRGWLSPIQFDAYTRSTYDYYSRSLTPETRALDLLGPPQAGGAAGQSAPSPSIGMATLRLVLMGATLWTGGWIWLRWFRRSQT